MATWRMTNPELPPEIAEHYEQIREASRLETGDGQLEEARTRLLIRRHLPPPPAVVADIGGGAGVYAHWLAGSGYSVHLRDPMPRHIQIAADESTVELSSARVGDARTIDLPDSSVDAVLLLGPLYHLTDLADRLGALREAGRVLKKGGVVFAAGISRYVSVLDGLWRNLVADATFRSIIERDLAEGQHRNPTGNPDYFTTAYFHRPGDLVSEVEEAGFVRVEVVAVEGIGWIMPDFEDRWASDEGRRLILEMVACTEADPDILGVSQHLLGIGFKSG